MVTNRKGIWLCYSVTACQQRWLLYYIFCNGPIWVCESCCNKCHRLGGLNNGNILSQSCGGWKYEIQVQPRLVPSEDCEETFVPSRFWWFADHLWGSLFADGILPVSSYCLPSDCALFSAHGILFVKTKYPYHRLGAHSTPVWPYPSLITSAITLFSNKVTFWDTSYEDSNIWQRCMAGT